MIILIIIVTIVSVMYALHCCFLRVFFFFLIVLFILNFFFLFFSITLTISFMGHVFSSFFLDHCKSPNYNRNFCCLLIFTFFPGWQWLCFAVRRNSVYGVSLALWNHWWVGFWSTTVFLLQSTYCPYINFWFHFSSSGF